MRKGCKHKGGEGKDDGGGVEGGGLVEVEAFRLQEVTKLTRAFEAAAGKVLGRKWLTIYEEWLQGDGRTGVEGDGEEGGIGGELGGFDLDPIVPRKVATAPRSLRHRELQRCLQEAGCSEGTCRSIYKEVVEATDLAFKTILRFRPSSSPLSSSVRREGMPHGRVRLSACGVSVELRVEYMKKLKDLYLGDKGGGGNGSEFEAAAFRCVARYTSAMGGLNRTAGGFHAALHGSCLEVLRDALGVQSELFASPLNAKFTHYLSAFEDVDAAFGSLGSFFQFHPKKGSFEANPPFYCPLLLRMSAHMEKLLALADGKEKPLSFCVIVRKEEGCEGWLSLKRSSFLTHEETLWMGTHGYCEGAAFMRKAQYRMAGHDSSIFLLQSKAGARKWPLTEGKLKMLTKEFEPRHMLERERKRARREDL